MERQHKRKSSDEQGQSFVPPMFGVLGWATVGPVESRRGPSGPEGRSDPERGPQTGWSVPYSVGPEVGGQGKGRGFPTRQGRTGRGPRSSQRVKLYVLYPRRSVCHRRLDCRGVCGREVGAPAPERTTREDQRRRLPGVQTGPGRQGQGSEGRRGNRETGPGVRGTQGSVFPETSYTTTVFSPRARSGVVPKNLE